MSLEAFFLKSLNDTVFMRQSVHSCTTLYIISPDTPGENFREPAVFEDSKQAMPRELVFRESRTGEAAEKARRLTRISECCGILLPHGCENRGVQFRRQRWEGLDHGKPLRLTSPAP